MTPSNSGPESLNFFGTEAHRHDFKTVDDKIAFLRSEILGRSSVIETKNFINPGTPCLRPILHLDYTASAQALGFIEDYIKGLMETYANTHTETSETGRFSTEIFNQAIEKIRKHVGAGQDSFVIPVGFGATGAIERIQKILGINMSPKGQSLVKTLTGTDLKKEFSKKFAVFVGPYEHHSNDVSWQDDALCQFVRIKSLKTKNEFTEIDLEDLDRKLSKLKDHIKIGSFSAASNVTGIKTDPTKLRQILKKHNALFFLDYAAAGPYVDINMERDGIDAIFLSAHKNLGGSNLGLLIGKNSIYDKSVSPTFGGGGTVSAVTPWDYHFHEDIEEREASGTPAIRQTWQAALSFEIKDWLGLKNIEKIEHSLCERFNHFFEASPNLELLGNQDPNKKIPIFSFLVKHGSRVLHHNLVAALLNDLFGIQARSGCACAGPFGHDLLSINKTISDKYISLILNVKNGFKPGWTRIGAHYTLDDHEIAYLFKSLSFIGQYGAFFINDYDFCPTTGKWSLRNHAKKEVRFGLSHLFSKQDRGQAKNIDRNNMFKDAVSETASVIATKIATTLKEKARVSVESKAILDIVLKSSTEAFKDSSTLINSLTVGMPAKNISPAQKAMMSILDPNEDQTDFSNLDNVDESVRFFFAPSMFDESNQMSFLVKNTPKTCPNKI